MVSNCEEGKQIKFQGKFSHDTLLNKNIIKVQLERSNFPHILLLTHHQQTYLPMKQL